MTLPWSNRLAVDTLKLLLPFVYSSIVDTNQYSKAIPCFTLYLCATWNGLISTRDIALRVLSYACPSTFANTSWL